jgi:hypothetical protein
LFTGGTTLTGVKLKPLEKNLSHCTLSIRNVVGTDLESSPGFCGERPTTNHQRHGTAQLKTKLAVLGFGYKRDEERELG